MKLSKVVLSALVAGLTTQATTSCNKKDDPTPTTPKPAILSGIIKSQHTISPDNCPGCGLG